MRREPRWKIAIALSLQLTALVVVLVRPIPKAARRVRSRSGGRRLESYG